MEKCVTTFENLVTVSTIAKLFRRSQLTISIWRNKEGLPYISIPGDARGSIRFDLEKVKEWGRQTKRRMYPLSESEDEIPKPVLVEV